MQDSNRITNLYVEIEKVNICLPVSDLMDRRDAEQHQD